MEYLIAVSVLVLIVSLIELVGVRKENEALENKGKTLCKSYMEFITHSNKEEDILNEEIKEIRKSDSANQGWNTRYRKTIEELKEEIEENRESMELQCNKLINISKENKRCKKNEDKIRWELFEANKKHDESHIVVEAIANNTNMKERFELANNYKFNENNAK